MRASGSGSAYSSPPGSLRSGKAGGSLTGRCVSGPALGAFPVERSEPPEPAWLTSQLGSALSREVLHLSLSLCSSARSLPTFTAQESPRKALEGGELIKPLVVLPYKYW